MDITVFLSQIFGPVLVIGGLGAALNAGSMIKVLDEISGSYSMRYTYGLGELAIGLAIVLSHNFWTDLAAFLISLFGWGMIVEGSLWILFPDHMAGMARKMRTEQIMLVTGFVAILMGAYLAYFGYFGV